MFLRSLQLLAITLVLGLFAGHTLPARAAGNLTIVADEAQVAGMDVLLGDLKDEDVAVSMLPPAKLAEATSADFLILVITADAADPIFSQYGKELLSDNDLKRIQTPGGKKLIVLRDIWKNGQEIVVFAGNTAEDAKAVRMETKDRWWEIVGGWFDIFTGGMKGY